ncbi:MAG: response regulator [Proteobacteria bacterium]|nr:response regulator [Pseudomonadota bacterium]
MQKKIKVKLNYTPNDVGSFLGVHHNTIKNWIKGKQVVAFQTVGGHYRVPRREVVRLIKNRGLSVPEELQGPMGLVYVVDDDELIRVAMEDALSDDYEVYAFSSGFEALMQIGRLKPDLLVLDIFMPGIDGFAMIKKLRQDDKLYNLKVIGMSGKDVSAEEAEKAGFDEFYKKEQGLDNIVEAVKRHLGTGR